MSNKLRSHLALFFVALIYGANFSIAKYLMDPGFVGPNAFILFRVLTALLLFWIFTPQSPSIERKDYGLVLICAISGVAGNQLLFFNGLHLSSPLHAALIMVCTPILVLVIKTWNGGTLNKVQWSGCILGFIGACYLILHQSDKTVDHTSGWGDFMVLLNASLYAYYLTRVPELIDKYGAFQTMRWTFAVALIPVFIFGYSEIPAVAFSDFNLYHWMAFAFVLIATSFLAYALNSYALQHSEAELVSNYIYLQPLLASILAILLKQDKLEGHHFLSACLIFTGLYLSSKKNLA